MPNLTPLPPDVSSDLRPAAEMKCKVVGCGVKCKAKGLCSKHYLRSWGGFNPHIPSQKELAPEERFKKKLALQNPETGCIEWEGFRQLAGYGTIKWEGKSTLAHRVAYELKHGPIPEGMNVLHRCDNPPCCNWDHLFLGSQVDNIKDRDAKGRTAKGETHCRAKLKDSDVAEIRLRLAEGEGQKQIAEHFSISVAQVSCIKRGKTRK